MGHTLKLEFGASNIDLTAGVYSIKTYVPNFASGDRETVTESAQIIIQATSVATLQGAIRDIEEYFSIAKRHRQTKIGDRVFITFQGDGAATKYRSELYSLEDSVMPGRVISEPLWMQNVHWDDFVAQVQITWERKNYWETYTEVELPLANGSQSKAIGGCQVFNPNAEASVRTSATISFDNATNKILDSENGFGIFAANDVINLRGSTINDGIYTVASANAAYIVVHQEVSDEAAGDTIKIYNIQNYVDILGSDIVGASPSPVGLYFTSETGGDELETFWISANRHTPTEFSHILDTEDSDSGSQNSNAGCVSGYYNAYSVIDTWLKLTGWTLPSQLLAVAGGAYFRVLARFYDDNDIVYVKLGIKILYGTSVLYEGSTITYDDTYADTVEILREIDLIQLPPFREIGTPKDLTLELWGMSTVEETQTINIDCLFLLPIDSWLNLKSMIGVVQNAGVSEYPYEEQRHQTVNSQAIPDIVGLGGPIMASPGKDMRIYFNTHTDANAVAEIAREIEVFAYHRPRVLTI